MEAVKKRLKIIAWFLTLLILLQSCVVYHKTPTTLEIASKEQVKTKVTDRNGEISKFKYISYQEGAYYGYVEEEWGEFIKVPLNSEDIISVRTKNKSASTWVTILVIAVPVLVIVGISAVNDMNYGGVWGG